MDDRRHGDVDLKDCIWGRRFLEGLEWVDGSRVGELWVAATADTWWWPRLAFAPEAFDVGVDVFGVTNWVRTLESIPSWWGPWRRSLHAELGNPERDIGPPSGDLTAVSRRQDPKAAACGPRGQRPKGATS